MRMIWSLSCQGQSTFCHFDSLISYPPLLLGWPAPIVQPSPLSLFIYLSTLRMSNLIPLDVFSAAAAAVHYG